MIAWLSLLGFVPATIFSLLALMRTLKNARAIEEVHITVNSRLTQLLNATGAAARSEGKAEGMAEGRSDERGERDARDAAGL